MMPWPGARSSESIDLLHVVVSEEVEEIFHCALSLGLHWPECAHITIALQEPRMNERTCFAFA